MNSKICLITGGTSGIGRAVAFEFTGLNAQVILVSRNERRGNAGAEKINRLHGKEKAAFIRADMANPESVRAAAQQIKNGTRGSIFLSIKQEHGSMFLKKCSRH